MSAKFTQRGLPRRRVRPGASVEERLVLHRRVQADGCWIWTGSKTKGYGRVFLDGSLKFVHRVSWEHYVGPIPTGEQIDHLCRNHSCFNPKHLEPVTPQENTLRGESAGAKAVRSGACCRGHSREVWGTKRGPRIECRLCRIVYLRVYAHYRLQGIESRIDLDKVFAQKRLRLRYGVDALISQVPELVPRMGRAAA